MTQTNPPPNLPVRFSELAKHILSEAADKGIPVIPVHDSFISSTSHAQKLSDTIHKQYEKRFGFLPVVES